MGAKRPTQREIKAAADRVGITLDAEGVAEFTAIIGDTMEQYFKVLDRIPERIPPVKYPRGAWRAPTADEDKYSAW
jgi:amidase